MMFQNAPLSTYSTIIFPINQKDKKFSRTVYSPAMTQDRINSDQIHDTLCFFEIIVSRVRSKAEFYRSLMLRYFLPFLILLFLTFGGGINGICTVWFYFLVYCCGGIFIQRECRKTELEGAKKDLEVAIERVQSEYLEKGLKWRVPENFESWIELEKEYRKCDENGKFNA